MGQMADLLTIERTITFKGKEYKLKPFDFETQGRFERWLETRGVEAIKRLRPLISEEEYREERAALRRDISAEKYAFGGRLCAEALQSIAGQKAVCKIMLRDYTDFTDAMIDEFFLEESDTVLAAIKDDTDPKATAGEPANL